jgi:hypothetical protein
MTIRTFQLGDETALAGIYNEASAELPKFKPATVEEIARRCRAPDFDPGMRLFAIADNQTVGYATFHGNGRISFPWCRKGHEAMAEPLFQAALQAMKERGLSKAFAAYRSDWTRQQEFFLAHGFQKAREMVNFVVDVADMPTAAVRRSTSALPPRPEEAPAIMKLARETLRTHSPAELEQHLFKNPYFGPEALFAQRSRDGGGLEAVGVLITNSSYANPKEVDPAMPCFRLGAFGTEGMQTKRINGLFSFLARPADANRIGLDLLNHAVFRLHRTEVNALAAQVPSDVPHLLRFYQDHFRRQGSFPVMERTL